MSAVASGRANFLSCLLLWGSWPPGLPPALPTHIVQALELAWPSLAATVARGDTRGEAPTGAGAQGAGGGQGV